MRILHFLPHLSGGGAEQQFRRLVMEQIKLGSEVHVAFLETGRKSPKIQNLTLHPLRSFSNYDPHLLWHLICITRRINPDVIQT